MAHWSIALLSVLLPVAAVGGGAYAFVAGHEAVADAIGEAVEDVAQRLPAEAPDYENLQQGDLCSIAKTYPKEVPGAFRLDVVREDGAAVDVAAARDVVADALPMIRWSTSPSAEGIQITVVDADLHFEGEDIAGVACGMSVLIEERYLLTSTLPHEVGHVFGLDHEDGSYMQIGRDPSEPEAWARWTQEQQVHLLGFRVAGVDWPERLETDATDPAHDHESGCGCGAH